jgi:hypothetical protein
MKGITIEELLVTSAPKPLPCKKKMVLKTCMQAGSGVFWRSKPGDTWRTYPHRSYILLRKGLLNEESGPDVIMAVNTDGTSSNIYGGEWNDGEY